jgi:hypothetical protein
MISHRGNIALIDGIGALLLIVLLSIVAYHGYRFQTKSIFYSIFPIFSWVFVDQPVLFNHIHHKEAVKLNCSFCHRYVERYVLQESRT